MKILEIYTGTKTYMAPDSSVVTPEIAKERYPAAVAKDENGNLIFPHVVETDEAGQTMFAIINLSAMRSMYDIDKTLTEDEAIAKLQEIMNTPPEVDTTPTPEERIAAAMEYQVMSSLPDEETV